MPHHNASSIHAPASAIGLGCVTFGREIERDAAFAIMDRAVEHGVTLFDTAEVYGQGASEQILGDWLHDRGLAGRVTVATKVHLPLTREHLQRAAEQSRSRLRVDRLDLLQLHGWDDKTPLEETCAALGELQHEGLVDRVGCSNFTGAQLQRAIAIETAQGLPTMASIQPRYSLVCREIEADVLPYCRAHGLDVLAYSPLGAGFLTGKYRRDGKAPAGTRFDIAPAHGDIYFHERSFAIVDQLAALATEIGVPVPQLAIGWVMRRPGVTHTLIGARHADHVDQAVAAQQLALPASLWDRLDELSRPLSPQPDAVA